MWRLEDRSYIYTLEPTGILSRAREQTRRRTIRISTVDMAVIGAYNRYILVLVLYE